MGAGWRLVKSHYTETAFSGEGARRYGGRWNSPGVPMVYTSAHLSLATLETMVHLQPLNPRGYYTVFRVEWPDGLMETLAEADLPVGWMAEPPGAPSMRIGDQWAKDARSAVLAVPSVLVPEEKNYLLNPRHADFGKIKIAQTREFTFDSRFPV